MSKKVKELPILFNAEMVRAILDGRKTQTRRVVKPQQFDFCGDQLIYYDDKLVECQDCGEEHDPDHHQKILKCPYGKPGDRLWVKETWCDPYDTHDAVYRADADGDFYAFTWRPSIHMPRWASRITLEIIDVRVERLWDITEEDAVKEGIDKPWHPHGNRLVTFYRDYSTDISRVSEGQGVLNAKHSFMTLWDSINAKKSYKWDQNPWVWVVEFKICTPKNEGGYE